MAFHRPVEIAAPAWLGSMVDDQEVYPDVAVFAQRDKHTPHKHHDCLQFADGRQVLLTCLEEGQVCTVLQLPAAPKNAVEVEAQRRVEWAG